MTSSSRDSLDPKTHVLVSVAKRQWEKTFDAIAEPLMIVDEHLVIKRANLALADDLGIAVQRLVGRVCHELRHESKSAFARKADSPCTNCPVLEAQRDEQPRDAELSAQNGRFYRVRAYPLVDDNQKLVVCRYRDVTEEKEVSRKLSHAEKLAAIGRLAGGVAHEINNPLGGILAFTQILLRDNVTAEERVDYLGEIEKSALRCKTIVESLLRFARQNPVAERKALSLNQVIEEALRFVQHKFRMMDVNLDVELEAELPMIRASANQIEQILINLLSNALDAVGAVQDPTAGRGFIRVRTLAEGESVLLEMTDSGPGISQAAAERIFDPFFTTKEEGKGTGLGLAVTYALVQEHGGQISARNHAQGGATFRVSFPALADPARI